MFEAILTAKQKALRDEVRAQEVRRIIDNAYGRARTLLVEFRDKLDAIAQHLIEVETIERQEFEALMA